MKDQNKSKKQLINELMELRQRIAELEKLEKEHLSVHRALFEGSRDAIYITAREGEFLDVNQSMLDLFGYSREEMIGLNARKTYVYPEDRTKFQQEIERRGFVRDYEIKLRKKNGIEMECLFTATVRWADDGNILGYQGIIRDITEHKQVLEVLHTEKQRFQTLSENAPFGIVMISKDGAFEYINPKFRELFGYDLNDVPDGRTWFRKAYPDPTYRHNVISTWVNALDSSTLGEKRLRTFSVTCKDGTEKIINFVTVQLETSETLMACEDITERKRAEETLRESEEKYRSILENIQDGYFEVDLAGNFTFVNDAESRNLGYSSKEELIGKNNRQHMEKEAAKKVFQTFSQVYKTGEPFKGLVYEFVRKDGTKAFSELSVSLIRDPGGKPIGFRGISRDITERKCAEDALRRSEERATQLSRENAIMAEIGRIVSSTLNIEEVYKRFAEEARELIPFDRISINTINPDRTSITIAYFFGVKIEESEEGLVLPLDRPFFEYILNRQSGFLIHPQNESELTERFPNFVRHFRVGIRTMIAVPLISKDQAIGILHIQSLKPNAYTESDVRLVERVGNQIAGAIANAQLFTARQRAEEELRKAHEMLEKRVEERTAELSKANELLKQEIAEREQMQEKLLISERLATLGLFSGSISHELKNPLSTIDSSVYYLKTKLKDADEKVRTHLDRIKSSVGSSLAIIDSLRNLTQIKEPRLQKIDLKSIVLDAIVNAEVPETVNVRRNIMEQEVLVNADPEQLKMAFKNIVNNAIQAMDGKGTLEVAVGKINGQAELSFTDTGPGIAPENIDKIFQPLFSTKAKGLGFGLSIAKMIIDKHSGTIQAKSEPGMGAAILIRLPLYIPS